MQKNVCLKDIREKVSNENLPSQCFPSKLLLKGGIQSQR